MNDLTKKVIAGSAIAGASLGVALPVGEHIYYAMRNLKNAEAGADRYTAREIEARNAAQAVFGQSYPQKNISPQKIEFVIANAMGPADPGFYSQRNAENITADMAAFYKFALGGLMKRGMSREEANNHITFLSNDPARLFGTQLYEELSKEYGDIMPTPGEMRNAVDGVSTEENFMNAMGIASEKAKDGGRMIVYLGDPSPISKYEDLNVLNPSDTVQFSDRIMKSSELISGCPSDMQRLIFIDKGIGRGRNNFFEDILNNHDGSIPAVSGGNYFHRGGYLLVQLSPEKHSLLKILKNSSASLREMIQETGSAAFAFAKGGEIISYNQSVISEGNIFGGNSK